MILKVMTGNKANFTIYLINIRTGTHKHEILLSNSSSRGTLRPNLSSLLGMMCYYFLRNPTDGFPEIQPRCKTYCFRLISILASSSLLFSPIRKGHITSKNTKNCTGEYDVNQKLLTLFKNGSEITAKIPV